MSRRGLPAVFPSVLAYFISTGNPIPNLESVGVSTGLVLAVVGGIGLWSMWRGVRELKAIDSGRYCHPAAEAPPG